MTSCGTALQFPFVEPEQLVLDPTSLPWQCLSDVLPVLAPMLCKYNLRPIWNSIEPMKRKQ